MAERQSGFRNTLVRLGAKCLGLFEIGDPRDGFKFNPIKTPPLPVSDQVQRPHRNHHLLL